jgi:enoyl-CoA hydratase/carnithine racemase
LKELGIVDAVLPASEVLTSAIAKARLLGEAPPGTYAMIKKNRVELTGSQIRSKLDEKEEEFLDLWYSDEARKRLKDAMAKF